MDLKRNLTRASVCDVRVSRKYMKRVRRKSMNDLRELVRSVGASEEEGGGREDMSGCVEGDTLRNSKLLFSWLSQKQSSKNILSRHNRIYWKN